MREATRPGMIPVSVHEITQVTHGRMLDQADVEGYSAAQSKMVDNVVTDSRQAQQGSLFVAIGGDRVDGHDFIDVAAQHGACAALVDHPIEGVQIPQIIVGDTVKALGLIASHNLELRRSFNTPFTVIGITGSVGKTTTKDLLAALLEDVGSTIAPVGSFNNEIGLPLTALRVGESTRFLVAEMGASQVGDITYLTSIVPPDVAIELKVGVAHLGVFGSVERIAQAKSELIRGLRPSGVSVLNVDDTYVRDMDKLAPGKVLRFGIDDGKRRRRILDMVAYDIHTNDLDQPSFMLEATGEAPVLCRLQISGKHNVANVLAAATVAHELGLSVERISQILSKVGLASPHRMSVSKIKDNATEFTLIDDSFNANPDSMKAGLLALSTWGRSSAGEEPTSYRIAVLGGMLELGESTMDMHREIGAYCSQLSIDALVAVGGSQGQLSAMAQAMVEGAEAFSSNSESDVSIPELFQAANTEEAHQIVCNLADEHAGSVVLLKGSHFSGLSALADRWQDSRLGVVR